MGEMIIYEIREHIGILSEKSGGRTLELNRVSWNGKPAKLDLRSWAPNRERPEKGLTLSYEEAMRLKELLNTL